MLLLCHLYQCFYRVKQASRGKHEWASLPVPTSKNYLLVTGLLAGTAYQFSVLPQNKLGSGSFSEIVSAQTQGLNCPMLCLLSSPRTSPFLIYLFISCANRPSIRHHSPSPGPSGITVSEPDRRGGCPPVVAPCGSSLPADGLCAAGPQESGTVDRPQQQHQCQ